MNCQEIHPMISSVSRGETSLTEWALVEAHLRHCAGCRAERERLDALKEARRLAGWSQALSGFGGLTHRTRHPAPSTAVHSGPAHQQVPAMAAAVDSADRAEDRPEAPPAAVPAARTAPRAVLTGTIALGARAATLPAAVGAGSPTPVPRTATLGARAAAIPAAIGAGSHTLVTRTTAIGARAAAIVTAIGAGSRELVTRTAAVGTRAAAIPAAVGAGSRALVTRGAAIGSGTASAIGARSQSLLLRGRVLAAHAAAIGTSAVVSWSRNTAVQVAGIALVIGLSLYAMLPTPILRPDEGSELTVARRGPNRPVALAASLRRGSEPAPSRTATVRSASMVATTAAQSPRGTGPHVIGRLTVKDRDAIEPQLTALLKRAGGARIGGRTDATPTVVHAVVPSSGYRKFTRGLAQIGAWEVEAERSPLPRGVRMTIRVDD
jgi:hypothetical protein